VLYVDLIFLDIHKQHDLIFHNINKDGLRVVATFFVQWGDWISFHQFAWDHHLLLIEHAGVAWGSWNSSALVMVPNASFGDIRKNNCHNEQLVQFFDSRLWDLTWSKVSASCWCIAWIGTDSWMQPCPMGCHMFTT